MLALLSLALPNNAPAQTLSPVVGDWRLVYAVVSHSNGHAEVFENHSNDATRQSRIHIEAHELTYLRYCEKADHSVLPISVSAPITISESSIQILESRTSEIPAGCRHSVSLNSSTVNFRIENGELKLLDQQGTVTSIFDRL